jgi:tetratricopeptide (TPR) repeat protein
LKGTISLDDVMAAYSTSAPAGNAASAAPVSPALLAGVLAAVAGVAVLGVSLGYYYRAERLKRGETYFREGQQLLQKDRPAEAIANFRNALSITHSTADRLALALALVGAGRPAEAAIYLRQVLRDRPASGPANLGMARALAQQGNVDESVLAYRRAIVGTWPEDAALRRVRARMELIAYLSKHGRAADARAELQALGADAPKDPALQKEIGRMLLDFGAAQQAAELYRGLLAQGPADAEEEQGLGDAAMALGDFRTAHEAYRRAAEFAAGDAQAAARVQMSLRALELDPTVRGIGGRERFRRSEAILRSVVDEYTRCAASSESPDGALQQARDALDRRRPPKSYADEADALVELAEQLWAARPAQCAKSSDEALARLMAKAAAR